MNPKITVLIPTKNRADYLKKTLKTCTNQKYSNLQVIVCDDGSTDNTREIVDNVSKIDRRIIYASPGSNVGMKRNFEFALNQVTEGYVIFLGGDDGLMPEGISHLAKTIVSTKSKLITWNPPIYNYPGANSEFGRIKISKITRSRFIKSKNYLTKQSSKLNYISDEETPMIYVKGAASIEIINSVKSRSKLLEFYSSPTPDGYSGIVLSGEVDEFYFSKKPYTIYGVSPTSQGMAYLSDNEKAKKQSEDFFDKSKGNHMAEELASQPYSPLISIMTADYLLTAKKLPEWPGEIGEINYKHLIDNAISELSNGLYAASRIERELNILKAIAKKQNLQMHFDKALQKCWKRKNISDYDTDGFNAKSIFINCKETSIEDIFDASYYVNSPLETKDKLTIKNIILALKNSIKHKIRSKKKYRKMSSFI